MQYNEEFWNKYADENESRYNEEFSKYIRDLASSLPGVQSILEIGCGTGIDLKLFSDSFQLHGIDLNDHALEIARKQLPNVNFQKGDITKLPFEDSSIDFVFTHGLMNYLDDDVLENGIAEMFRISTYALLDRFLIKSDVLTEEQFEICSNKSLITFYYAVYIFTNFLVSYFYVQRMSKNEAQN